jgi:hypothetical protein
MVRSFVRKSYENSCRGFSGGPPFKAFATSRTSLHADSAEPLQAQVRLPLLIALMYASMRQASVGRA